MDLSVIIPVYNESKKVQNDIKTVERFLKESQLSGEIIVVDDGSSDQTAEVAKAVRVDPKNPCRVIHYEKNQGKGYAVRTGIKESKGDFVLFADSGCCIDYRYALKGMDLIKSGQCDIANASRKHPDSIINRPPLLPRQIMSKFFRLFTIGFMNIPANLTDTQCGFKVYKGEIGRELYGENQSNGLTFDIEIILRAIKKGYRILEFPVEWSCDHDTRVIPILALRGVISEFINTKRLISKI